MFTYNHEEYVIHYNDKKSRKEGIVGSLVDELQKPDLAC